jgi:ribosomal protein S18 acetylase RimI-like enzyme
VIRIATSADASAILPIFLEVLRTHAETAPSDFKSSADPTSVCPWLSAILADQRAVAFVAIEQGNVIGYLFALEVRKDESPIRPTRHYLSLEHVAVLPGYRRRGIATALVSTLFAEAKAKNIDRIELDVWSFNETSQRFFEGQGFKGVSQHFVADVRAR